MSKIIKSISIDNRYSDILNNYIPNFSEFVNEILMEKFMTLDKINEEINKHESKIKFLEKLKSEVTKSNKLNKEEKAYLIESSKKIEEENRFLKPKYKYFCNYFNKKLSLIEFKKLLNTFGGKNDN